MTNQLDELQELPHSWTKSKLSELCNIVYGKNLPTTQLIENGFPVFGANGIIGFHSEYLYEQEQVMISCRGAYSGKINFSPPKVFITNNSLVLEFYSELNETKKYFYYILQAADRSKLVTGSAQPQVTINNAVLLDIPLPPLSEQHRIVAKLEELFTKLDVSVAELKKAKAQIKRYRQSVLKSAFEGKLKEEWRKVKIEDVSECLDYLRKPINKEERKKRVGIIPYYGANGRTGWIDNYLFDEPLVLVVEDETFIGRELPFSYKITGKSWVNNHAHILKPKKELNIDFLNYQLFYYPFTPLTTGTTGRKKLTKNALMNAEINICSLRTQNLIVSEIERHFSVADATEKIIDQSLKQAERLRQSILKDAFTGKLVPQDPNDEPAEKLLERIKAEREKKQVTVSRVRGKRT